MITTVEFEVGRVLWSDVRNIVLHAQTVGEDVTLREGEGVLSRSFFVSGSPDSIERVRRTIDRRFNYTTAEFTAPRASWKRIAEIARPYDVILLDGAGIFIKHFTIGGHPDEVYEVLEVMTSEGIRFTRTDD